MEDNLALDSHLYSSEVTGWTQLIYYRYFWLYAIIIGTLAN